MRDLVRACAAACCVLVAASAHTQTRRVPEARRSTVGYNSVAAALAAVRANPKVRIEIVRGWIIATNKSTMTIWSFAPKGDPSYPSVVKRVVKPALGGGSTIDMSVECEASKKACDNLVREFERMNGIMPADSQ